MIEEMLGLMTLASNYPSQLKSVLRKMLGLCADMSSGGSVHFCLAVAPTMPAGRNCTDYQHQPNAHAFILQRSHQKEHDDGEQVHHSSAQFKQWFGYKALIYPVNAKDADE